MYKICGKTHFIRMQLLVLLHKFKYIFPLFDGFLFLFIQQLE